MRHPNPGTPIPPKYKHVISVEWFRVFPFKDRIKILFGYGLVVKARIVTVNAPGQFHADFNGTTTPLRTPAAHVVETIKEQKEKEQHVDMGGSCD